MNYRTSQITKTDPRAAAFSGSARSVERTIVMSNIDRRAAAQAALKAIAMQETARPTGAARFAALEDGLMHRIDRETTRKISRIHTRPIEPAPSPDIGN